MPVAVDSHGVVAQLMALSVHAPQGLLAQGVVTLAPIAAAANTRHVTLFNMGADDEEGGLGTSLLECVQHCPGVVGAWTIVDGEGHILATRPIRSWSKLKVDSTTVRQLGQQPDKEA